MSNIVVLIFAAQKFELYIAYLYIVYVVSPQINF